MKILLKVILSVVMWGVSVIYPYGLSMFFVKRRNILYTLWLKNFVGQIGNSSTIHYPCSLQGGGNKHILIGQHTCIQSHCILGCWNHYNAHSGLQSFSPEIIIGNHCNIGEYTQITACNKISIGDGLLTGRYVYIGDNSHGGLSLAEASIPPVLRKLQSKGEIVIGKNVWIGDKVTVLGGLTIGDNVIIGANSVVTHDLPSNCVAIGTPAKVIKSLK